MTLPPSRKAKRIRNNNGSSATDMTTTMAPICCLCQPAEPVECTSSAYYTNGQQQQQSRSRSPVKSSRYSPAATSTPMHHHLPKTMSVGTAATSTSSRSMYSSYSQDSLCPVTNVYANINQDYHIFHNKIIGKGHYGIVRECIHRATRQTLAVKSIDKSKIGRLDHLKREIHLLANIKHHGVMKMVDCYEDAKYVHIITEKYTGGELFDKIADKGCLSEHKAVDIIKSLLEAVAYLHENGVVHRDIKPENILFESMEEDAAIKLIDFGLSRRHEKGEGHMSNPVGTSYYMSPELLKGRYDKSCDIWAIGVVAYIILCGYPPYNGSSDREIQESIRGGNLQFAGNGWQTKSDETIDFIKCLLRRDPRKRFTAKEALMHPWIRNMMTF